MYGYIYETTNLVNGKKYIGQKVSSVFVGNYYHGSGKYLMKALYKYGNKSRRNNTAFSTILIEECDNQKELDEREIYWINYYRNKYSRHKVYNRQDGGHSNRSWNKDIHLSEEHKHKISNSEKGKYVSKETKDRISKSKIGNTCKKGTKVSDTSKMIKSSLERWSNLEERKRQSERVSGSKWMHLDSKTSLVPKNKIDNYLSAGWEFGRNYKNNKE